MKQFLVIILMLYGTVAAAEAAQRGGGQPGRGGREALDEIRRDDPIGGLAASEAKAAEAEKAGRWDEAASSYLKSSQAARAVGQLQKAIDYGIKSFDLAARINDPFLQASAALKIALALRSVGQKPKAAEWLDKGAAAANGIT